MTTLPNHGTRARYLRGCKCDPCRAAHSAYCKRYRYLAAVEPRRGDKRNKPTRPMRTDVAPVAEHIARLIASGMTLAAIQREASVSNAHASKIMRGQVRAVHRAIAARILAVEPLPAPDPDLVDPVVVERLIGGEHWRALGASRAERIAAAEHLAAEHAAARERLRRMGYGDQEIPGASRNAIERRLGLRAGRDYARRTA